jgi:alkylated DNA nucleotide flippase Atl1
MKKTWAEKLKDKENFPKILKLEKKFPCYNALHKMGVSEGDEVILVNPSEIREIMEQIPCGKLITLAEICRYLAGRHGVKGCCTLTSGIFIMTIANAVEEAARSGIRMNIPYWRTLKADGYLNPKYPGGEESHKKLLEAEGLAVIQKGKRFLVRDHQDHLHKL